MEVHDGWEILNKVSLVDSMYFDADSTPEVVRTYAEPLLRPDVEAEPTHAMLVGGFTPTQSSATQRLDVHRSFQEGEDSEEERVTADEENHRRREAEVEDAQRASCHREGIIGNEEFKKYTWVAN